MASRPLTIRQPIRHNSLSRTGLQPLTGLGQAGHLRWIRRGQDHLRRFDLGDPAAADRSVDDDAEHWGDDRSHVIDQGALGAVVLVDSRRLDDCHPAIDYFEERGIPFVVALNWFDGSPKHDLNEVRYALDLVDSTPLVTCDARREASARETLVVVLDHVLAHLSAKSPNARQRMAAAPPIRPQDAARALRAVEHERALTD